MNVPTVSIYCLVNPIDKMIFYVGCTHDPSSRLSQHMTNPYSTNMYDTVSKILFEGLVAEMHILEVCDITEASYWEEFYISFFKSYGFPLNQSDRSYYTQSYYKKMIRVKRDQKTLNIHSEIPDGIEVLAKKLNLDKRVLVRMALREFIAKYRNIIEEKDDSVFKDDFLPMLSRKLKQSHDHYYWDVNTFHS